MRRYVNALTLVLIAMIFVLIWIFFQKSIEADLFEKAVNEKQDLSKLIVAANEIEGLWREGVSHQLWKKNRNNRCLMLGKDRKVNDLFLRCNPGFLECVIALNNGRFSIDDGKQFVEVQVARDFQNGKSYHQVITRNNTDGVRIPAYGVQINLQQKDNLQKKLPVIFEDSCWDTYLPQMIYGYGEAARAKGDTDWRWDNLGKSIFIDKYLVSFRDVALWMRYGNPVPDLGEFSEVLASNIEFLDMPAYGLTFSQMEEYCAFRGKQILSAEVFDAASFHPGDGAEDGLLSRGPYPWGRKERAGPLYEARTKQGFQLDATFCRRIYTKECESLIPFSNYENESVSWMGIFHVLGGYLEAVRNPLEPLQNLKASSFYFDINSSWHRIGKRAHWDGLGFSAANIDWGQAKDAPKDYVDNYKIGFRCMRYVPSEN